MLSSHYDSFYERWIDHNVGNLDYIKNGIEYLEGV